MENSKKIIYPSQESQSRWYLALNDKWIGPLKTEEICDKIKNNEITLAHYLWKEGQQGWKRICELSLFEYWVPQQPAEIPTNEKVQKIKNSVKPSVKAAPGRRGVGSAKDTTPDPCIWFLHDQVNQYGPFSEKEVKRLLSIGQLDGKAFAWCEGMVHWQGVDQLKVFEKAQKLTVQSKFKSPSDLRSDPRKPLVAKIWIANSESVIVGVCRDISIGGLQILTETVPGTVGSHLKMNISPPANKENRFIEPFVAEGIIIRILEDGRGFSFRFENLSEKSKQTIEHYIRSST